MSEEKVLEEKIRDEQQQPKKEGSVFGWIKRLGFAGFMFFLVKGLVWLGILIIPAYLAC